MNLTLKPTWGVFGKGVNSFSMKDSDCHSITQDFFKDLYKEIDCPNGVYSFIKAWRKIMAKHEKILNARLFSSIFKPTPGKPTSEQTELAKKQEWWEYVYSHCGSDMAKTIAKLHMDDTKKNEIVNRFRGVVKNFRGYVMEVLVEAGIKKGEFLNWMSSDYEPCTNNYQQNIDGIATTTLGTHKIGVQVKNWRAESVDRKVFQQLADELEKWQVNGTIPEGITVGELNKDTWMYVISAGPVSYFGNIRGIPENRESETNKILSDEYGKRIRVIGPEALDQVFSTENQTQREFFKELLESI